MKAFFIFSVVLLCFSCSTRKTDQWQELFNGKNLDGWDTYIGPPYDTTAKDFKGTPVGLNSDPLHVFSVADVDGEKVLRISGEQFGGISTKAEFGNYHLQFQFKWGKTKHIPRTKDVRDSGLMYHAVGEQGADYGFWMRSHEFQIEEGDCVDYWACAGAIADVTVTMQSDSVYVFDPSGKPVTFGLKSPAGRYCKKNPDAENASGEWNTIDLYCMGNQSIHVVNGKVTMVLNNLRQEEASGEIPLTKGKIQLESEGAEIYYRNIRITSINKMPKDLIASVIRK
jgi:hypothetical protein